MAKGDELVKYITERVVHYVETPKTVRREHKAAREPWRNRWFGMIPFSLSLWWKKTPIRRKNRHL